MPIDQLCLIMQSISDISHCVSDPNFLLAYNYLRSGEVQVMFLPTSVRITIFRKLAGKTLFITGASRGIGKSIALKAAKDGANIVIAAKTATPHPKLPGTIYTAAKEGTYVLEYCMICMLLL